MFCSSRMGSPLHFQLGPRRRLAGSAVGRRHGGLCPLCPLHSTRAPLFWEDSLVLL